MNDKSIRLKNEAKAAGMSFREYLETAIEQAGSLTQAARNLSVSRETLYKYMSQYGIATKQSKREIAR